MQNNSSHRIALLLAVAATLAASSLHGQAQPVPPGLSRAEPVACSGNQNVVLRGRFIETASEPAVRSGSSATSTRWVATTTT